MYKQPLFIMLMGLPGSGKSHMRNKLMETMTEGTVIVLSTDDYIDEIAELEGKTYSEVFDHQIRYAQAEMQLDLDVAIENKFSIIHDQTNLTSKKRIDFLKKIPKEYFKVGIFILCDEKERQKRLTQRPGKIIPSHVDISMIQSKQEPQLSEGFDQLVATFSNTDIKFIQNILGRYR